ncbi:TspO/MBR family protein [Arthrobacter oryzae]|jgi:tryptophan-rich sensory protein|uniref:TspO/MBR family protein n=1 Tax=Arthrobacter oryzae TaxID=409290 RepID=UPI00278927E3|nr:TspO/MBR family protein [Arthrobacter oryzae]MDQ0077062.1 tryptophan-rich sensory protein [Arthrobacter oryzae]
MQAHHEQSMASPGASPGGGPVSRTGYGSKGLGPGVQVLGLAVFLGASALVAWLGAFATVSNVNGWYVAADKAPWSPPNWVFGPVWTLLYTAMAVAAWLVWRRRAERSAPALVAYGIQLLLNLLWTPVFFGLYPVMGTAALWLGFAVIIALIVAVTVTVLFFGPISRAAGLLLLPYVSWLVFAASLNLWAALHN